MHEVWAIRRLGELVERCVALAKVPSIPRELRRWTDPPIVLRSGDHDVAGAGTKQPRHFGSCSIADIVEHHVESTVSLDDVVSGVVDYVVGAERPNHVDVSGAADGGHIGAERDGDLHGKGADAAG